MTLINDQNDEVAKDLGFKVQDHPRGRHHAHSAYELNQQRVWLKPGGNTDLWRVGTWDNERKRYVNQATVRGLVAALNEARNRDAGN